MHNILYQKIQENILMREILHIILRENQIKDIKCVVGKNFGLFVTHEAGYYLQAIKGQITVVVWK
ncbi:unnamed protein product [Paramecium sonneborni]|uniref:Uncharacterized protein n=1 Tax=Paramecium sonneborni TaxID=65129 RepID=A0A8S1KK77_9CILI|nr:unnamed protein product [Paramecium sonneborni]